MRYTATKIGRIFEKVEIRDARGVYVETKTVRREPPVSPAPRHIEHCLKCGGEARVSVGQIFKFHKRCRASGRRRGFI